MKEINRIVTQYVCYGMLLLTVLIMGSEILRRLYPDWHLVGPIGVSVVFSTVMLVAFGLLWRWVAGKHHDSLTTLYSATSGFRMLLALFTLFGCYLAVGRDAMVPYVLVFMVYYLVMVAFHSIFFTRITNKQ